ncbi:MAG: hypothetical protein D6795_19145 [Deltaproteobacteria bacterium]|nr:MAG: hypothetical protein D6795_19145 [Deltaproteobacteria bacterium]
MEKISNGNFGVSLVLSLATILGVGALLVSFVNEGVRRHERATRIEKHRLALQIAESAMETVEEDGLEDVIDGLTLRYPLPERDRALAYHFERQENGFLVSTTGIVGEVSRTIHLFIPEKPASFRGIATFALR